MPFRCRAAVPILALMLTSCAGIQVMNASGEEKGIEFFPAKPYLLLESTKEGAKTSLFSLPDVSRPMSIRHKRGMGSVEFGVTLSNGMLAALNQKSDVRAPELLTALGSLATGIAALGVGGTTVERRTIIDLAEDMRNRVAIPLGQSGDNTIKQMGSSIGARLTAIQGAARVRVDDGTDIGRALLESDKVIRKFLEDLTVDAASLARLATQPGADPALVGASTAYDQIFPKLQAQVAAPGAITLFEILPDGAGGIQFRRVTIPL